MIILLHINITITIMQHNQTNQHITNNNKNTHTQPTRTTNIAHTHNNTHITNNNTQHINKHDNNTQS